MNHTVEIIEKRTVEFTNEITDKRLPVDVVHIGCDDLFISFECSFISYSTSFLCFIVCVSLRVAALGRIKIYIQSTVLLRERN